MSVSRVRTTYASICSPGRGRAGDAARELQEVDLAHAAVPPTVIPVTRSVG